MRNLTLAFLLPLLAACRSPLVASDPCDHLTDTSPDETADSHGPGPDTGLETGGDTGDPPGPLVLADPTDGDTWAAGSVHHVTWTYATPVEPETMPVVVLEGSTDGGATWTPLEGTDGSSGAAVLTAYDEESSFAWRVPEAAGTSMILRLRDDEDPAVHDRARVGLLASQAREYAWTKVTMSAPFAARDGAGAVTHDGAMFLLGGWNPSDPTNFPHICNSEVWRSTDGLDWTEVAPEAPWEGRHTAGYVEFGGRIWILGGDPIQGHYQPDAWSSVDGVTWTLEVEDLPWGHRVLHHTAVLGDRILVMGGQTLPPFAPEIPETVFYNDVWASEDGVSWTQVLDDAPWPARGMIGGSAVLGGRLWLLGGGTYDTPEVPDRRYYDDVWVTEDGVAWTQVVAHAPWAPRQYHDVAAYDDRIWVFEGYGGGNRNDVWYSADGENWYEVPDTPWAPRHAASVFVLDDSLWMVAGNNMQPDVWRLSYRPPPPEPRRPHPAVRPEPGLLTPPVTGVSSR